MICITIQSSVKGLCIQTLATPPCRASEFLNSFVRFGPLDFFGQWTVSHTLQKSKVTAYLRLLSETLAFCQNCPLCFGTVPSNAVTDQKSLWRTSLVAKWLRIRLPMQGTRVQVLVREDPTCCRTTKPVRHNY